MSLLGLGRGMTVAFFHICGMQFVLSALLIVWERSVVALGPMCLRCSVEMLSGPSAGEFLACLMACDI